TSGGTESVNLALKGLFWAAKRANDRRSVLLIAEGEHHATIDAAQWLCDTQGATLRTLPLDADGVLHPDALRDAISEIGADRIALLSFLLANNEVGSVQPAAQLTA